MRASTEHTRERQYLVFNLAGLHCALPLTDIQEVVPRALLSTPPGLPEILDGFLNLRGVLVPVVRMGRLFNFPPSALNLQTPLLIVRNRKMEITQPTDAAAASALFGLGVDQVCEVISAELYPPNAFNPGSILNDCVVAQVGFGNAAVHVLSTGRLLAEQERQTIARLQTEMQERLNRLPA